MTSVFLALFAGHDVLFQDADVIWLRDPLAYFAEEAAPAVDTFWMDDGARTSRYAPYFANSGFYYLRANDRTQHLMYRMLQSFDPKGVFWINALDPISLSGLQVPELRVDLPRRVAGHHMVYADGELALVSERNGRVLTIMLEPEDCHLAEVYGVLRHLLLRSFEPRRKVTIDTINDIAAPRSPYLASLRDCFDVVADYKSVYIQRRVGEI